MRLVFVDDDALSRKQLLELAREDWPDWEISAFESLQAASDSAVDVLVIDMSALTGVFAPDTMRALGPLTAFIDRHPGAAIVINTAIAQGYVEDLIEDIVETTGVRPYYGGWACGWDEDLRPIVMQAAGLQ